MSRADEIRAQAAHARARQSAEAAELPPPAAPVIRQKPVRKTVDLPPERNTQLANWCTESAQQLGVARVTSQDVLAALVARLLADPALTRVLRTDLAKDLRRR